MAQAPCKEKEEDERKLEYEESVGVPGGGDITVEKGVDGPLGTASRTLEAGDYQKGTFRKPYRPGGVEIEVERCEQECRRDASGHSQWSERCHTEAVSRE